MLQLIHFMDRDEEKLIFFFANIINSRVTLHACKLRTRGTCQVFILQEMFGTWVFPVALQLSGQQPALS